jgi:dsRNA-specific ribonuclease
LRRGCKGGWCGAIAALASDGTSVSAYSSFSQLNYIVQKPSTPLKPASLHHDALSSITRSLVALIYQRRSLSSAREFAHQFFLSREVDLRKMLKFRDPKVALTETVAKFGREKPMSRCASTDMSSMT